MKNEWSSSIRARQAVIEYGCDRRFGDRPRPTFFEKKSAAYKIASPVHIWRYSLTASLDPDSGALAGGTPDSLDDEAAAETDGGLFEFLALLSCCSRVFGL